MKMIYHIPKLTKSIISLSLIVILVSMACSIPFLAQGEATPELSGDILTQAAATISYQLQATATELARSATEPIPPTSTPKTEVQAPIPASSTPTTSPTSTSTPTHTSLPIDTETPTLTSIPTIGIYVFPDTSIRIRNLNIFWCYGIPWAIFKITNQNPYALESSSLQFEDLTDGGIIAGPYVHNNPFMLSDRTCSTGIDRLPAGSTLYLGNSLGTKDLREHEIHTTLILCSKENLAGECHTVEINFIFP